MKPGYLETPRYPCMKLQRKNLYVEKGNNLMLTKLAPVATLLVKLRKEYKTGLIESELRENLQSKLFTLSFIIFKKMVCSHFAQMF